jgi:phosphoglycolate phosphatase
MRSSTTDFRIEQQVSRHQAEIRKKMINKEKITHSGFQAVIFDLDGTLLDTLADIGDAVNCMLMEFGFPTHTLNDYRRFIGNGISKLVFLALPLEGRSDVMFDNCLDRVRELYGENWNRQTRPYDGILDMLDRLKQKEVPMAVLSNKPHDFTVRHVNAYFDRWEFKAVMGQNDRFPIKPDPAAALDIAGRIGLSPSAFLFVGDSGVDMQTAMAAGMHSVGAKWGFKGPQELMENGCQTLVSHPREIPELLNQ